METLSFSTSFWWLETFAFYGIILLIALVVLIIGVVIVRSVFHKRPQNPSVYPSWSPSRWKVPPPIPTSYFPPTSPSATIPPSVQAATSNHVPPHSSSTLAQMLAAHLRTDPSQAQILVQQLANEIRRYEQETHTRLSFSADDTFPTSESVADEDESDVVANHSSVLSESEVTTNSTLSESPTAAVRSDTLPSAPITPQPALLVTATISDTTKSDASSTIKSADDSSIPTIAPPPLPSSPVARRPWSEHFNEFLEVRNIRWGEIIGGLLIVGCSIALIVSLHEQLDRIPHSEFWMFSGLVLLLYTIGIYSSVRWNLPHTSIVFLSTATLLVPLCFTGIIQRDALTVPQTLSEFGMLSIFGVFLYTSSKRLIAKASTRWQISMGLLWIFLFTNQYFRFGTLEGANPFSSLSVHGIMYLILIPGLITWLGIVSILRKDSHCVPRQRMREQHVRLYSSAFLYSLFPSLRWNDMEEFYSFLRGAALLLFTGAVACTAFAFPIYHKAHISFSEFPHTLPSILWILLIFLLSYLGMQILNMRYPRSHVLNAIFSDKRSSAHTSNGVAPSAATVLDHTLVHTFYPFAQLIGHFLLIMACAIALFFMTISRNAPTTYSIFGVIETILLCVAANRWKKWISVHWIAIFFSALSSFSIISALRGEAIGVGLLLNQRIGMELLVLFAFYLLMSRLFSRKHISTLSRWKPSHIWLIAALGTAIISLSQVVLLDGYHLYRGQEDFVQYTLITLAVYALSSLFVAMRTERRIFVLIGLSLIVFLPIRGLLHEGSDYFLVNLPIVLAGLAFSGIICDIFIRAYIVKKPSSHDHLTNIQERFSPKDTFSNTWTSVFRPSLLRVVSTLLGCSIVTFFISVCGGFFHMNFAATWIEFLKMYVLLGLCGFLLQNRFFKMLGQCCVIGAVLYLVNVYAHRVLDLAVEDYYVIYDIRIISYFVLSITLLMLYWSVIRVCIRFLPMLIYGKSPHIAAFFVRFRRFCQIPEHTTIPWSESLTSVSRWSILGAFDRYFSYFAIGLCFIFAASSAIQGFLTYTFDSVDNSPLLPHLTLCNFGGVTAYATGLLPWTVAWIGMAFVCILWMWDHWRTAEKIALLLVIAIGGILGLCWLDRTPLHDHLLLLQLSACWILTLLYSITLLCIGFRSPIQKKLIHLNCDVFVRKNIGAFNNSCGVLPSNQTDRRHSLKGIVAFPRKWSDFPWFFDGLSFVIFALPLLILVLFGLEGSEVHFWRYFGFILLSIIFSITTLSWRAIRERVVGFLGIASLFLIVATSSVVRYFAESHGFDATTLFFWARMTQTMTIVASIWTSLWCIWMYQKQKRMGNCSKNKDFLQSVECMLGYFERSRFRQYIQILQQSPMLLWAAFVVGSALCYLSFPALTRFENVARLVPTGSFTITWTAFILSAVGYFVWNYTTRNYFADQESTRFKLNILNISPAIQWIVVLFFLVFLCTSTVADRSFHRGYPALLVSCGVAALLLCIICVYWKYIHVRSDHEKAISKTFTQVKQQQILTRGTIGIGIFGVGLMALWLIFGQPFSDQHVAFPYGIGALACGFFAVSTLVLLIVQNQFWTRFLFMTFWMSGLWISIPLRFSTSSIWTFNESVFSYLWIGFSVAICIDALSQTLYDRWTQTPRDEKPFEAITSIDLALFVGCIPIFCNFMAYTPAYPWTSRFGWETWIGYLWIAIGLTIRMWNRRAYGNGRLWWTFGLFVTSFAVSLVNSKDFMDIWILIAFSTSIYALLGAVIPHIVRQIRRHIGLTPKTNFLKRWKFSEFIIAQSVLLWIVTFIVMLVLRTTPLKTSFDILSRENFLYTICTKHLIINLTILLTTIAIAMTTTLIAEHQRQRTWKKLTVLYSMFWIANFLDMLVHGTMLRLFTISLISIWVGYFAWLAVTQIYMRIRHLSQPKTQRKLERTWTATLQSLLPLLKTVTIWIVCVALLFEVSSFSRVVQRFSKSVIDARRFEILYAQPLDIVVIALALVLSIGVLIRRAITISRQPNSDISGQIKSGHRYIWYAESVVATLVGHIYITMPFLFGHGFFEKYGIFVVLAIAFAGTILSEIFQRMKLDVLCKPLSDTAYAMPLLMAIFQWFVGQNTATAWCCISVYYLFVALTQRKPASWFLTVISFLFAFWTALHQWNIQFMGHIQVWMIPPAIATLIAQWFERNRLTQVQNTAIRWFSLAAIYGSSTTDMFLVGLSCGVTRPLVLMFLSVGAIFAGMLIRMRSIQYLGVIFLLIDLLAMIKYAAVDLQQTWILWCSGIALGGAILTLFAILEKRGKAKENEQDSK